MVDSLSLFSTLNFRVFPLCTAFWFFSLLNFCLISWIIKILYFQECKFCNKEMSQQQQVKLWNEAEQFYTWSTQISSSAGQLCERSQITHGGSSRRKQNPWLSLVEEALAVNSLVLATTYICDKGVPVLLSDSNTWFRCFNTGIQVSWVYKQAITLFSKN